MKQSIFMLIAGACTLGCTVPAFSQDTLPEVIVVATNYKYIKAVGGKEVAQPVNLLQRAAAAYDVKNSDYYEDDYDTYFVSFFIPDGQILAAYDKSGKLIRTAEKYKNVKLPSAVSKSVTSRFPSWKISSDAYLVTYYDESGATKKYKLLLENGDKRLRVKVNEKGEFL
ncbi:MAG: nicotinate-nucleotide adenylyltransferase [Bacteroidota bacterium]|nr:nicotinate-nucleotide adenylyltransferase [Bacteroidota bacterium]